MIRIFVSPSCSSCRKVKKWFDEQRIPYELVNIFSPSFSSNDIKELIVKSENGTDDIISKRSKIVQEQDIDFDEMTISQLIEFIRKNPSILKRPIIYTIGKAMSVMQNATRRASAGERSFQRV